MDFTNLHRGVVLWPRHRPASGLPQDVATSVGHAMWVLYARAPAADARHWPGRRWLALLGALIWPALFASAAESLPISGGVILPTLLAACTLVAVRRCVVALWHNERYRFVAWRLGIPLTVMLAFGLVLKAVA